MSAPSVVAWAVVCLAAISMAATDYSGKWSADLPAKGGGIFAVLQQDDAKLTGSAGPGETKQFPITTGKVEGDHLVFEVKTGGGTIHFDLTGTAGELRGTARILSDDGHTDSANIVLKRVPQ